MWFDGERVGTVKWDLIGDHNVSNALMTIAAALRPVAAQVRHTPGKHIITRLEKKVPGLKL